MLSVTAAAMSVLLRNSRGSDGSSSLKAVCQPSRLTGDGMSARSRTESAWVLNDDDTLHANGMNISTA